MASGVDGGERESPAFPPLSQLFSSRIDAAALFVGEAMNGQPLLTLPTLHGTDAAAEIRGYLLPRVQPAPKRMHRGRGELRVRVVGHQDDRIATYAKTRHGVCGMSLRLSSGTSRRTLGTFNTHRHSGGAL